LRIDDLELAFPNNQAKGTRLVLTQSTYLLQKWIDTIGPSDRIIATATGDPLRRSAAEAFERRGPWRRFEIVDLDETTPSAAVDLRDREDIGNAFPPGSSALEARLARAFHTGSGAQRLRLCREAFVEAALSPVAALACASACREQQDLAAARKALDTARQLAPDWEAIHYEDGKFWLACEEMELACEAFQRAAERMPSFSAAYSNLGATLGELDRPEGALAAFAHALESDPESFTLLNNVGVVNRELGRLAESEAALSRVIQIAPDFVFGHYNLGHTRLLRGDYRRALEAYEEGQRRDGEKNRRQGCRLAIVRFANGDVDGAQRDLWRMADAAPPEEREDLLLEAYEIAQAVVRARPELAARRAFIDRIAAEIEGPSK
jgi:tetratricopeptide (TPR) repeat protein